MCARAEMITIITMATVMTTDRGRGDDHWVLLMMREGGEGEEEEEEQYVEGGGRGGGMQAVTMLSGCYGRDVE